MPPRAVEPLGAPTAAPPPQTIGPYALIRTFSQGPIGAMHLARHPASEEPIALKTLNLSRCELSVERFLHESRAALVLAHPSLARTLDAGFIRDPRLGKVGWIATAWAPGSDLRRYTQRDSRLPEALAVELAGQIASALAHAHGSGVVHRNIKPSNLLFDLEHRRVRIAEFGGLHLTAPERIRCDPALGLPRYLAPEQVVGVSADGRCDLYTLGVVLHELLTGVPIFGGLKADDVVAAVMHERPSDVRAHRPHLPRELADLLHRLLAKTPSERPADGDAVARELQQIASLCR